MNAGSSPGLLGALKRGLRTAVELAEVRLALFATELQQEKLRALESVAWLGFALLTLGAGLVMASLWLLLLLGEQHRLTALGVLALLYFGAAALAWHFARARQQQGGGSFQATLAEFSRDRVSLMDGGLEARGARNAQDAHHARTDAATHAAVQGEHRTGDKAAVSAAPAPLR